MQTLEHDRQEQLYYSELSLSQQLEELQRALAALETSVRETGRERDECLIKYDQ